MSVAGKVWTSPNTALGLVVGAVGVMLGGRAAFARNALEFYDQPLVSFFGKAAVTLGNTIHYAPGRAPAEIVVRYDRRGAVRLGEHERAHTLQYERWGPFFLPVYVLCWLPWVPPAGNRFEHAADDEAERGGGSAAGA